MGNEKIPSYLKNGTDIGNTVFPLSLPGGSWCHRVRVDEEFCHDWIGQRGRRGHCDRYGHHREVQPQQTVPLQTLGRHGMSQHVPSGTCGGEWKRQGTCV